MTDPRAALVVGLRTFAFDNTYADEERCMRQAAAMLEADAALIAELVKLAEHPMTCQAFSNAGPCTCAIAKARAALEPAP